MRAGVRVGRVAVVGAGQVGTSLGMALRGAPGVEGVVLHDRDPEAAAASLARGAGDSVVGLAAALDADAVLLALPVPEIVTVLPTVAEGLRRGTLVLDTGSAKRVVVEEMRRLPIGIHAIGGHPLAGTERPGAAEADPSRLRGAAFVLTPAREDAAALERARAVVLAAGARPVVMDAAAHDRAMARTSHLAHLLAFAMGAVAGADASASRAVASTGYLGATRLAAGDPQMIAGFLAANADEIRAAAGEFRRELDELVAAVEQGPPEAREALAAARGAWEETRP